MGFCCRVLGIEDAAAEGDAVNSRLHDVGNILLGDASDGNDWDIDIFCLHLLDNFLISFKTEDRGELLLGSGEAERTAADVIGTIQGRLPGAGRTA